MKKYFELENMFQCFTSQLCPTDHILQLNISKKGNSACLGCKRSARKQAVPASPSYRLKGLSGIRADDLNSFDERN